MIGRAAAPLALAAVAAGLAMAAAPAGAIGPPCEEKLFKAKCFGLESLDAALSDTQAGAHPDLTYSFGIDQDPESPPDSKGTHNAYAPTRNVRFDAPPGLIGNPAVLGVPQQCTSVELIAESCPRASQIGNADLTIYNFNSIVREPIYMMAPPGGDVIARVGFSAIGIPVFADATVRSEGDYGLSVEITDAAAEANVVGAAVTLWGVPAAEKHDTERCTPQEVFTKGCTKSAPLDPGGRELPFITNPTRCGVPLAFEVSAASWAEPERFDTEKASFPQITGCNELTYGPGLSIQPTNRRAAAPTGLDITARIPGPPEESTEVLEPSHTRHLRVELPEGMGINTSAADGLGVCSEDQVKFGKRVAAECPDAAKLGEFEAEIPALPRRMRGALYLREPEPGNLFRFWAVADDLGAHVKLQGQLNVDEQTGQIESVLLDLPQAPIREVKLVLKSGFRAPLVNPPACGTYASEYEFVPWSGGPPVIAESQMKIDEGCEGLGGFEPRLTAGSTDPTGGKTSPFVFRLTREDGEQNPASLEVTLPRGLSAILAGIPRCDGAQAETGQCPAASRIGQVVAAAGAGPTPLWVPQPGKRPTAVYLGGPYKGAPLSVIAVVPTQAGPFDLGDEIVRSAIFIDPATAQGTVRSDPLPQIIEGVPIRYRTVQVELNPGFSLNPTSCAPKTVEATITSSQGAVAKPSSPFTAVNCAGLSFKPRLALRLFGGTSRGSHPALRAILRPGGTEREANIKSTVVRLPHSAFLDQAHIRTVCTRVQYAAKECPAGSIYGQVTAFSPQFDEPLAGPVYLRSSNNPLPDMVASLHGIVDVEAVGRIDSVNGGIRSTFESVPDARISKVVLKMQGGKKGLIVNSRNLCTAPARALAQFEAHNGRKRTFRPPMQTSCGSKKGKRAQRSR